MAVRTWRWRCAYCMHVLLDTTDPAVAPPTPSEPCPACGRNDGQFALVYEGSMVVGGVQKVGVHAGGRRRNDESFAGVEFRHETGRLVYRRQEFFRREDWYVERIVDVETGEVVYEYEGLLSDHTGHGAAKRTVDSGDSLR